MAYGHDMKIGDPYVDILEHALEGLTESFGVGFAVDSLSFLRFIPELLLPGGGFKKLARNWRRSARSVLEVPWASMRSKYVGGVYSQRQLL